MRTDSDSGGRRWAAWFLDLVCLVFLVAAVAVLATGGFQLELGSRVISVHGVNRPITILLLLALLRSIFAPKTRYAFAWNGRGGTWTPVRTAERLGEAVATWRERLDSLSPGEVRRVVLLLASLAVGLRAANGWFHQGFYSGDDVEVLQMAFAPIAERAHSAWDLRNAFFPMFFIYPPMKALHSIGVSDLRVLFFSGRMAVVLGSAAGVLVAYGVGRVLYRSAGAGLVVAFCVAFAGISTKFSGSELPRPIAGTLVLAAFLCLIAKPGRLRFALLAGAILGLAGSLRFSEVIFMLPACLALLYQGEIKSAFAVAGAGLLTMALVVCVSDMLYWGDAFHSSAAIVQFTLLEGRSTRGFQPWFDYSPLLIGALSPVGIALLVLGWCDSSQRMLLLWTAIPVALLSLLPHKETRYLVPLVPLFMVVIGGQVWFLLGRLSGGGANPAQLGWFGRLAVLFALPAFLGCQVGLMNFPRSADAIDAARLVSREVESGSPATATTIAFEQSWVAGGWLYLGPGIALIDLDTGRNPDTEQLQSVLADTNVRYIGLGARTLSRHPNLRTLVMQSFRPRRVSQSENPTYLLFERDQASGRELMGVAR